MNNIRFRFRNTKVTKKELETLEPVFEEEIEKMVEASKTEYEDERASIHLPFDLDMENRVTSLVEKKSALDPDYIVLVGIGGSNLGTMAVQQAVQGRLASLVGTGPKMLYAETVDAEETSKILSLCKAALEDDGNVLVVGVSKSGTTVETISLLQIFTDLLKKHRDDYREYIVTITDKGSKLWKLSKDQGFSVLEIPANVGGRYSVLSAAGLFPLGMLGLDITELEEGAAYIRDFCLNRNMSKNPSALSAAHVYLNFEKGKIIHDIFLFGKSFEALGKWYRQLMGESLGKEHSKDGNKVNTGITPTYSVGSTDLHSVAQLYLGGPKDKMTTFVSLDKVSEDVRVPEQSELEGLVENIQDKGLHDIMKAIDKGLKAAYKKKKLPFIEVVLPDNSERSIGMFLQFKMMEMMFLGAFMNVNPFDQPNVEGYKVETKKRLAS